MQRRARLLRQLSAVWRLRLVLVLGCTLFSAALAWQVALLQIREGLEQTLLTSHRALQTEIGRFRYLPRVAGEDMRIHAALDRPGDPAAIAAANRYLEKIATQTGSGRLYLLDARGVTLASSNWAEPDSYVGHDYSFRPYFTEARATGSGAVYAIGVTTGEPGYFISARVEDLAHGTSGVIVVKIDLHPLELAWAETGQHIAVTDAYGVVFLSSRPDWRYRPLAPLSAEDRARIAASRLYAGAGLDAAAPLGGGDGRVRIGGTGAAATLRGTPFEGGWRIVAAAPP
ncbi:cache domain-containing protein, partial [Mangrovicoccus algicola]|nr:sensor histidine kinase [Mangrovicoccus algicola]